MKMKKKIGANLQSPENPNGLLTKSEQSYLECFEIKHHELELIFREDETFWKQKVKKEKSYQVNGFDSKIKEFLAQTEEKMNKILLI